MSRRHFPAALLAGSTLVQATTFVVRPTVTYRAIELGVSPGLLGLVGATFAVVPLVVALPAGRMVDRFGEIRMMRAGAVLCLVATVLLTLDGQAVWSLMLATGLLGAGHLACVVGQQALVANSTLPSRMDSAFGYYTFAASLGQALGPGLVALFGNGSSAPDTDAVFRTSVIVTVALVAVTFATRGPRPAPGRVAAAAATGSVMALVRTPGLLPALYTSSVILSAIDITVIYLPALGAERGLGGTVVGVLLVVRGLGSMAARLGLGYMSRRLGRNRLLIGSIVVSALALALLAVPMPVVLLGLVMALGGLGLGVGQPLTMSWLASQAAPAQRGTAMSLRLTGNRIGQVALPAGIGAVAASAGAAGVLLATAVVVGSTGLLLRRTDLGGG